jgi:hypothetical protein
MIAVRVLTVDGNIMCGRLWPRLCAFAVDSAKALEFSRSDLRAPMLPRCRARWGFPKA